MEKRVKTMNQGGKAPGEKADRDGISNAVL